MCCAREYFTPFVTQITDARTPDWKAFYSKLASAELSPSEQVAVVAAAHEAVEALVARSGVTAGDEALSLIVTARAAARSLGRELPDRFAAAVALRNRIGHRTSSFSSTELMAAVRLYEQVYCVLAGQTLVDAPADLELPEVGPNTDRMLALGDWVAVGSLGEGGFGEVLLAHHVDEPDKRAAVKVLHHDFAEKRALLRRFAHERNVLRTLGSGNQTIPRGIVRYFGADTDVPDTAPQWIALEFVEGRTLGAALVDGMVPSGMAMRTTRDRVMLARHVGVPVAEAALYAHGMGIAHRDIKPRNIMLCPDGRVVLLDFGIAADARSGSLTRTGAFSPHSPGYAPPEVAMSREAVPSALAPRVDVYSLGVVLLEVVTGEVPDPGRGPAALLGAVPDTQLRKLLERMLDSRADYRPDMVSVVRELRELDDAPTLDDVGEVVPRASGPQTWSDPEEHGTIVPRNTPVMTEPSEDAPAPLPPSAGLAPPVHRAPEAQVDTRPPPSTLDELEAPSSSSDNRPLVAGVAALLLVAVAAFFLWPSPPPAPGCGDGILQEGEGCDDGNRVVGDGCDASCNVEDAVAAIEATPTPARPLRPRRRPRPRRPRPRLGPRRPGPQRRPARSRRRPRRSRRRPRRHGHRPPRWPPPPPSPRPRRSRPPTALR